MTNNIKSTWANWHPAMHMRVRELLWEMTANKCWYCGGGKWGAQTDHYLARSKGGNEINNLVPACSRCNTDKSDFSAEEFRGHVALRRGDKSGNPHQFYGERLGIEPISAKDLLYIWERERQPRKAKEMDEDELMEAADGVA